jgi:hypothetical protein
MEEVPTFVLVTAMAIAIAALFGWLFSTINVAAPIDRAYAFLYPYVKPYNSSYAWIGVKPREGVSVLLKAVEVDGVLYPVNETVSGLTWLMPVPCGANVTFLSQYGSASRADTWRVVCINRETTQMPTSLMAQLAKQLLAVGIDNPAVSFDIDPLTGNLVIHNLNNLTWLVAWNLPNNGIYSSPPTINYKILGPYGTIEVPFLGYTGYPCPSGYICLRRSAALGLNFYLLYPINASNTAPLFSTPSPVLKVPIGVSPYGVIVPGYSLANAPVQYATLDWLNNYTSSGIINSAQAQDILSSVESGGFVLDPAPLNTTSLQAYIKYAWTYETIVVQKNWQIYYGWPGYALISLSGYLGTYTGWFWPMPEYETGTVYLYSPNLCGVFENDYTDVMLIPSYGTTAYVYNLTIYNFGFACPNEPTLTYTGGQVLIQFPYSTLAIPATIGTDYLVTRSLSWSFQAIGWQLSCGVELVVYSGNNTIEVKAHQFNCQSSTTTTTTAATTSGPSGGNPCYTSYNGPYDVSLYPANGQTSNLTSVTEWDVYGTYIVTKICNGQVVSTQTERLWTGTTMNGQLITLEDPFGKTCPVSQATPCPAWKAITCGECPKPSWS